MYDFNLAIVIAKRGQICHSKTTADDTGGKKKEKQERLSKQKPLKGCH